MYSHELANYIKEHNYQLNAHQLEFVMDTREHPQITRISYNDQFKSYDMFTSDNYRFSFGVISYEEYCKQISNTIYNDTNKGYKLYIATEHQSYTLSLISDDIISLFPVLDNMILDNEYYHNRYLIIFYDNEPSLIYHGFGNKLDYLRFKKQILENIPKSSTKSLYFK